MPPEAESSWLAALRAAAKAQGQKAVGLRIGYSTAVVSQMLSGTYKGDLSRVQQAVEGALMGATVECPLVGELPRQRCADYQRRGFESTNPMRVAMSRECPKCPNRSQAP